MPATMTDGSKSSDMKVTFVEALHNKYVNQDEFDNNYVLPKDDIISTDITLIGFGKISDVQRQLKRLSNIDLSGMRVASAGDTNQLKDSLNRVQVINLADNLLTWKEVVSIVKCMPNLKELVLNNNPLKFDDDCSGLEKISPSLKVLALGRIFFENWTTAIQAISRLWDRVEQIDLWYNCFKSEYDQMDLKVNELRPFVSDIKTLKFSYNSFNDLDWISRVGPLHNLVELDLSHCSLKQININEEIAIQLQNLIVLNVSHNNIGGWQSISELHKLSKLTSLICHTNPFYTSETHAKHLTIGRLKKIKVLNREDLTRSMRRDAEILYLRLTFPQYKLFKEDKNSIFESLHPRYNELIEIYGLPEDQGEKQVNDAYIDVDLCYGQKRLTKKLPCDMRIANVHMLCKRLFKLKPSSNAKIICQRPDVNASAMSYELDKGGQTLHFFSVKNGYQLVVTELDD